MKCHRAVRPSSTRLVSRAAAAQAVETLEQRSMFNAAYFNLASGSLAQNWDNSPDQLTTANTWTNVPSIEGYNGAGITSGTSVNPTTFTAATPTGALNVAVNVTTSPNTYNTGGLTEFNLTTPIVGTGGASTGNTTVAFQGSGGAPAPYLKFYLNSQGVGGVRVKYDLIDIDGGVATAAQQVNLQYRLSSTDTWKNVTGGYVADASDPASGAVGKQTTINVVLPSDAAGAPTLEVRVQTSDAAGVDQLIAVENIVISGEGTVTTGGTFALAASTLSTPEAAGTYNIVVNRTGGSTGTATINYAIAAGTATTPADFTAAGGLTGTVTFVDGQTTANIPVTIVSDNLVEGNETFSVALSTPSSNAALGTPSTATVTIVDDDFAGTFAFSAANYTVNENAGTVTLTVNRTSGMAGAVVLNYATSDGSATSGSDYTGGSGTVSFADGQTSATITIPILNDTIGETTEAFTVTLTSVASGTGAIIGTQASATVTINDDDTAGQLTFSPATYSVNEGAGTVTLTITRLNGTTGAVSALVNTVNGTAVAGSDFTGLTNTVVNFVDGQTTATVVINITDDTAAEANENFTVTLSGFTGGSTAGAATTATVTIVDNDVAIPSGLLINEFFIDPPSSNTPYQYVEIRGTPGTILSNVFIIDLEGDFAANSSSPGQVDSIFSLSGFTIGTNGLLILKASVDGFTPDAATTVVPTDLLNSDHTGFEVGSQTLLLVYRNPNQTGAVPVVGDDFDTDDAPTTATSGVGTLEAIPANLTILDGVGTTDGGTGDLVYTGGALTKLNTGGAADAIVRFSNATAANSAASFYYGILADNTGSGSGSQTLTFSTDATRRSTNFPSDGIVTPGTTNVGTTIITDTTPPTVVNTSFDPRNGQKIVVVFSEDVSASLAATDFTLTNTTTGVSVTLVKSSVSSDGTTVTLTFSGTTGLKSGAVLLNGKYTFSTLAGQVADAAGNTLVATSTKTFNFLNGDFNFDGVVDFNDLVPLAQNYNGTGKTFAQGDANYDGTVDFNDLVVLAQNYNQSLSAALASFAALTTPPADPVKPSKNIDVVDTTPIATTKTATVTAVKVSTFATTKRIA